MKNRLSSIAIVFLMVIGGFIGFVNIGSENAQGTFVNGIVYDGSGGPWTIAGNPYIVVGDVTVPAGETLTIEPGVEVKFDGYYSINVDGTLTAVGTETMRIIITSNKPSPAPGDWRSIRVTSSGHIEIKYCDVSYNVFGIRLYSASNNIISNNTLSCSGRGINVRDSSNNTIIHNNILNNDVGIDVKESSNNIIAYNNVLNNDIGISLHHSSNNTVTNNNFVNDGISISGDQLSHFNSHTIPDNNIVNGKPLYYYKNCSGITIDGIPVGELILANCTDFDVKNLQINNTDVGIEVAYSTNISISDNNLSSNDCGIDLYSSSYNKIINNDLSNDMGGIEITTSSNNNIIANNNISSFDIVGVLVSGGIGGSSPSNNNVITNNNILSNNSTSLGIGIGLATNDNSLNNTVTGNNVSNNMRGIHIGWTSENKVIRNNVSNNDYGISISFSNGNDITNNSISNGEHGLYFFEGANDNVITGNTVSNNDHGVYIYFYGPSNNRFYHNNFINNTNQACDDTNNGNQWDNGYPSGGNYWSDFDEPSEGAYDDYKGPNQDDPTSGDGIVDNGTIAGGGKNPYVIDSDSQDNYPLIYPTDTSPPTITNLQPPDGSTTNDNTSTISADYSDPSGINVSSVVLKVDGMDVTSSAVVTASGVSYMPITALPDGAHTVYLEVKDNVGNLAIAMWSFTVDTSLPPMTNLTTKVVNNGDNVELEWEPSISPTLDHYLIYRADSATGFDFTMPYNSSTTWPDPKNTTWVDPDPKVTAVDDDFYYIVRAANADESDISTTSNTAGVWTRTFQAGTSTFSLPLEPFVKRDVEFYCQDMNASYIKWMNQTTHTWMLHNRGDSENNTIIEMGEGYEIGFLGKSGSQTRYTFTGMPGAMIIYDDDILFSGFDHATEARNLTVSIEPGGNVTLNWEEPNSMGVGDWYEVYYSNERDGFFKTLGVNYSFVCLPVSFGNNTATHEGARANDPGARLFYMVVPFNAMGIRGASTYSLGIWTEEYLSQYDTIGIPLKLSSNHTADWYCDNIPDSVGINYFIYSEQRWSWHSTRMPGGAYDVILEMTEGYQISTSNATKFTFIGV